MPLPFLAPFLPFIPLIGSAIGAVGSVISANKAAEAAKQPQVTRTEVDYVKMRKNAEAAGINPLAALRNGGAAGHAVVTRPVFSSISPFGEGLQAIGGAVSSFDWQGAFNPAPVSQNIAAFGGSRLFGDPVTNVKGVKNAGPWQIAEPEPVVGVRIAGHQWEPDMGWSNAQEVEDRYGDLLGSVYGGGVLLADGAKTAGFQPEKFEEWWKGGATGFARYLDRMRLPSVPGAPGVKIGGGF